MIGVLIQAFIYAAGVFAAVTLYHAVTEGRDLFK